MKDPVRYCERCIHCYCDVHTWDCTLGNEPLWDDDEGYWTCEDFRDAEEVEAIASAFHYELQEKSWKER